MFTIVSREPVIAPRISPFTPHNIDNTRQTGDASLIQDMGNTSQFENSRSRWCKRHAHKPTKPNRLIRWDSCRHQGDECVQSLKFRTCRNRDLRSRRTLANANSAQIQSAENSPMIALSTSPRFPRAHETGADIHPPQIGRVPHPSLSWTPRGRTNLASACCTVGIYLTLDQHRFSSPPMRFADSSNPLLLRKHFEKPDHCEISGCGITFPRLLTRIL